MRNLLRLLALSCFSVACLSHVVLILGNQAFERNAFYSLLVLGVLPLGIGTIALSVFGRTSPTSRSASPVSPFKQKFLIGLFGYLLLVLLGNESLHDRFSPEIQNGNYVLVQHQKRKPSIFISEISPTEYVKRLRATQLMATAVGATMLFAIFTFLSTDD